MFPIYLTWIIDVWKNTQYMKNMWGKKVYRSFSGILDHPEYRVAVSRTGIQIKCMGK